jgi:hypothetical protein
MTGRQFRRGDVLLQRLADERVNETQWIAGQQDLHLRQRVGRLGPGVNV